ncbi:MAG: hypothetical protein OQK51_06630 [Kangiellaceae bacterium]|nr:hypothetical protein [Kangiellaceae bacterium]
MLKIRIAFSLACSITLFGSIIHLVAPFIGEYWYSFMRAPSIIVLSSANGTLLAPISAVCIGIAMFVCSMYAVSAYKDSLILPAQTPILLVVSILFLTRGLIIAPVYFLTTYSINAFDLTSSVLWFITGASFLQLFCHKNLYPVMRKKGKNIES